MAAIAATDLGRNYLVEVIDAGLMGPINVGGTPYMGVMPAQGAGLDDQSLSDVLNYSVLVLDAKHVAKDWKPYTAEEVAAIKAKSTKSSAAHSASLRLPLAATYPELF